MLSQRPIPVSAAPFPTALLSEPGAAFALQGSQRWYVAQTLAKREFGARLQLEAQKFRAFCPHVIRSVRHARQARSVKAAFFPGYLFIALDLQRDRWRSINGTLGVSRVLTGGGGMPLAVPHGVVETLLGYLDDAGVCRFERDLQVGQNVRLMSGPFAQSIGTLVRLDPKHRVRVLLQILGGRVYATMEMSALEAAK